MIEGDLVQRARYFPARKQLGQNFLVNKDSLQKIVDQLCLVPGDNILEIGAGLGFLTELLTACGARVQAIELDQYCIDALQKLALPRLTVIANDVLQVDFKKLITSRMKVVGNIPYNITTPIIGKLLGEIGQPAQWLSQIEFIVLTVQRELAQRLVAAPGKKDYSQITLLMNYFGRTEVVLNLPAQDFLPVPKVDSAVIKFIPYDKPPVTCRNHLLLRQVIQAAFANRRKMLKNNLASLHLSNADILQIFNQLNFDPYVRAESLSLVQYARLADSIEEIRIQAR
jgi:16S rRNA (adenine1518-N6/adenine1519-N6)-dimethyltransferase